MAPCLHYPERWECRLMVLFLICHMADSSAKPGSPAVTHSGTADSSMWLALLLPPLEVFWGWTGSVSLHAINLSLGLPKKLSQLLVADISQLPMWNSLWGLTTEFRVCLWVVSWQWADKIAFFSHCAHCGYSSKGWGCFSDFIRMWVQKMALQPTSVCSLSVILQHKWLPWSSGIALRCLCTCVVQHFPLIITVTPLLQHLMLFLSQGEEDLALISVSISSALSHVISLNFLQLMRLPL